MATPVRIQNGDTSKAAQIHESSSGESGLLVFAANRDERRIVNKAFINPTFGIDMTVNGTGTPSLTENIHDGIDNVYWTASALSGSWTFDSTAQNHTPAGTKSIDGTATTHNDSARIDKGSTFDVSTVESLTGWIYITSWPGSGTKDVSLIFNDSGGLPVGNLVDVSGYVDVGVFGAWQQFTIPVADFGLTNQLIQSLDITTIDIGGGAPPNYYIDDLSMSDASVGYEYRIEPDKETTLRLLRIKFIIRDVYAATSSGQHAFDASGFLGVPTLTNGILANTSRRGAIIGSAIIKDLSTWMGFPQFANLISGSDGTNTWLTFEFTFREEGGLALSAANGDALSYVIRDDLSGLLQMQAIAEGYVVTNEGDGNG